MPLTVVCFNFFRNELRRAKTGSLSIEDSFGRDVDRRLISSSACVSVFADFSNIFTATRVTLNGIWDEFIG